MARATFPVSNGRYTVNNGVLQTSTETLYHLNAQDTNDYVDLSSHTVTLSEGETFLCWVRIYQLGTAGSAHHPGIFSTASTGGWDDFFELYRDAGAGTTTTGTGTARFAGETAAGSWINTNTFGIDLDNNPWMLVGFTSHTDGTYTFWLNDGTVATNSNNSAGGESFNINFLGPGYAGDDTDGIGHKDMDSAAKFNRELTATEVSDWYTNGIVPDTPAHHWKFDDNSDTSTAVDSAGTADGTINNATYAEGNAF